MIEQRSTEWFAARLGKVTASRVGDVMAQTKSGYSASRANYMAQLIAERLTGTTADSFSNAAMQWGTDTEPLARAAYAFENAVDVVEVGFVDHPTIADFGASPDGLVGDDGMVEIKCPNTATHIDTLLGKSIDRKYLLQMQTQMICTGRAWCDFVSFDPRLPVEMQMHTERVARDDALIETIDLEVAKFLAETDDKVSRLRERFDREAP